MAANDQIDFGDSFWKSCDSLMKNLRTHGRVASNGTSAVAEMGGIHKLTVDQVLLDAIKPFDLSLGKQRCCSSYNCVSPSLPGVPK